MRLSTAKHANATPVETACSHNPIIGFAPQIITDAVIPAEAGMTYWEAWIRRESVLQKGKPSFWRTPESRRVLLLKASVLISKADFTKLSAYTNPATVDCFLQSTPTSICASSFSSAFHVKWRMPSCRAAHTTPADALCSAG